MEIRAYSELYIESAQNIVGHMFDFAINELEISPDEFANLFLCAALSKEIERGNPKYVAGSTGPELARAVLDSVGISYKNVEDVMYADRSPEYWAGWVLAYYQWYRNYSFGYILKAVPFSQLLIMYHVYHEMDIMKFVETMDEKLQSFYPETALRRRRELLGLSQRQLSDKAGVPLRQIQLFEQRQRDITKAQAFTLLKLSKVLLCNIEDLLI